ncbi:MAG: hypothetical protein OSB55_05450 [Verrucomicrobiota bacterium]|nr:hypothetical protein [Verrucomicrobiota bacterium]
MNRLLALPYDNRRGLGREKHGPLGLGALYSFLVSQAVDRTDFPFSFLSVQTLLLTLYMMFEIKNRFSSVNIEFVLRTIDLLSLGRSGSSAV